MTAAEHQVAKLFDQLASTYDQVGVDFFVPMAERLVTLLALRPGESTVDLGCGRGAVTFALANAVGPTGRVLAGDLSTAMVEATRELAQGLPQVAVVELNAARPAVPPGSVDVVASAAVIFFLSDPVSALTHWVDLLVPGGRLGFTTFGRQDDTWAAVDALFDPFFPKDMLDARAAGKHGAFASSAGVDQLARDAGAVSVNTLVEPVDLVLDDAETWRRWTMSVGQRRMWGLVPDSEKPRLFADAATLLENARESDGLLHLRQDVRYTIGHAPL